MDPSAKLTIPDLLRIQVAKNPDKDFLVFESEEGEVARITYGEMAERVAKLANHLAARGVGKGDRVVVMMTNRPEFLMAWFAANQIGAMAVPVNTFYTPDELAYLVENSECAAIVTQPKFLSVFEAIGSKTGGIRVRVLAGSEEAVEGYDLLGRIFEEGDANDRNLRFESDTPAQIIYTSGTTSRPKGAVLDHGGSVLQGISTAMLLGMRPTDRTCVVLPLFHVNAQYVGVIPTLLVGGTVVLLEIFSASKYWNQVRKHRCTAISIVPMILRTMLAQPPSEDDARHDVRFSFYALPTSPEEWRTFETRFGVTLVEGYGLSETYGICTSNPFVYGVTKRHCIGLPIPGHEIRVVDDDMNDRAAGEVGQIAVGGKPLFQSYFKNREATDACMRDGWFLTGDNGFFDEDGYLHFFDRSKDVIKRAGENIAATEVERVLNDHPKIMESAVIAVFDPLRDEAVKAYVVCQEGETLTEEEVREWSARYLSKFKVPSFVEFRDSLPKTSIGKIQKFILKAEHKARMEN